jgi:hypothetical protein
MTQWNRNSSGSTNGHYTTTSEPTGHNLEVADDLQQTLDCVIEGVLCSEPESPPPLGEPTRVPLREVLQQPDRH